MSMKNSLASDLEKILSKERVLTSFEECYVYAQDGTNGIASDIVPSAVVFPHTIEEVQKVVKYAYDNEMPVVARGSGTNLVGACVPEKGGIIINFNQMDKILSVNKTNMTAVVQPGVVVGKLQQCVEEQGLFFPPDPSNLKVSTIGGAIAQSAGGPKTFKYGTTKDYILGLKVVLADGSLIETGGSIIKNATGYHLEQFFIGSEGTLGIVVEAILKLIPKPESTCVVMAYFDDVEKATNTVTYMIDENLQPSAIEFMDKNILETVEKFCSAGLLTDKESALIIELDGFSASMENQISKLTEVLEKSEAQNIVVSRSKEEQERIWTLRRASFAACAKLKPDVISNDVVVPRENISKLVSGINKIAEKYNLCIATVGHVGDGNLHPHFVIDLNDEKEKSAYEKAKVDLYNLTLDLNGTLSAEHGIGTEKRMFMQKAIPENTLNVMKNLKKLFDKKNILNPNKIFYLE